jgi:two-component system cell cycle sensor histidine kinase/response regulator CckA
MRLLRELTVAPPVRTVLLVDDDGAVRSFTSLVLTGSGYRVLTASDGAEGVLLAESMSERIDLLLSDIEMPVMGGLELADRLTASHPETKFLFISGAGSTLGSSGMPAGAGFLPKPYTFASLLRCVRELLQHDTDSAHGLYLPDRGTVV